ncbi:response regulator transcription factor, partial [Listeria monocytogenes]|uniref:response regulator n=1 Tax=Listeria monocytogenes TaxID=1639 RepID=UPI000A4F9922
MALKIMIIEDHQVFREDNQRILGLEDTFEVVSEAGNGKNIVAKVLEYKPDIVLMDINMPTVNGLDATEMLVRQFPSIKVIVLTIHDTDEY